MNNLFALCLLLLVAGASCVTRQAGLSPADVQEGQRTAKRKSFLHRSEKAESAATTWKCVGEDRNRTCLFKNLYYTKREFGGLDFVMFLEDKDMNHTSLPPMPLAPLPEVLRSDKYSYKWRPAVKSFANLEELNKHVASKAVVKQPGLSVHFNPLFHHNIGHALFDGLYPAYMALMELGLQDKNFRPVVGVDAGCFDADFAAVNDGLKPGDVVEAYLPHSRYNKSLQPTKVEILDLLDKTTQGAKADTDITSRCSFIEGYDSSAVDLGAGGPVPEGLDGHAACCKMCDKAFGCSTGVVFNNVCYLKGKCADPRGCDRPAQDRFMCRYHEDRRPQVDTLVRRVDQESSSLVQSQDESQDSTEALKSAHKIPMSWVVARVRERCMSEGIFETFGKSKRMLRLFEMDRDINENTDVLFKFDEIVIGSSGAGNMVASNDGAIGGSAAPTNAMARFRDRMLEAYDLPVGENPRKDLSDPSKPLDVIIVANKRFDVADQAAFESLIETVKPMGKVNAEYIDWRNIGEPGKKFREHLKRVQKADIYISSIGTALQYVPFMRDQRVYLALGSIWQRSNQTFPTFMEQQLAGGGTPYLRTLYADPGAALRKGPPMLLGEDGFKVNVNKGLVLSLLDEATSMVRSGFKIPVPIRENLSKEGQVLVELCQRDPKTCQKMQADRNGLQYECATQLWPECVVYEVGPWRNKCNLNRSLLRQLRKEYGLSSYGAPEM